jgi:hypothetical protein
MPVEGIPAIERWLATQPLWTAGESRYAEVARSRDMGYTYGTYAVAAAGERKAERGFYARVWVRGRDGGWKVVLDVLQPQ